MGRGRQPVTDHQRAHIASVAARILATEGINDYQLAKQKAVLRLGIHEQQHLPSNDEVEQALFQHLQLFDSAVLSQRVHSRRRVALNAMIFLADFQPKLVGSVLRGTVTESSEIQLHLCADTPEQVATRLMENDIPYEIISCRLRYGGNRYEQQPAYRFMADDITVELLVFSPAKFREKPLNPVDGKVMARANVKKVETLLADHIE